MPKPLKITEAMLLKAIDENLTAYEIAKKFNVSHKTAYNKIDEFGLNDKYYSKKQNHHNLIKDLARAGAYKALINIVEKANAGLDLRASEYTFLTNLNKADGLISDLVDEEDLGQIKELVDILDKNRREKNIKDEPKNKKDFVEEILNELENEN